MNINDIYNKEEIGNMVFKYKRDIMKAYVYVGNCFTPFPHTHNEIVKKAKKHINIIICSNGKAAREKKIVALMYHQ